MNTNIYSFIITTLAGLSTLFGLIPCFLKNKNQDKVIIASLSFSAGVMLIISLFSLIPESLNLFTYKFKLFPSTIILSIFIVLGIIFSMTDMQKFRADVQRLVKHNRADNNGRYNAEKTCNDIIELFLRETTVPGALPQSCAEYWKRTYIDESASPENEPTAENVDRLGAILSFLENSGEDEELLTDDDWRMLGELVNYEAEDLPLDILQALMGVIVQKGAL